MIPKLQHLNPVQSHYLEFLKALEASAFKGDICPDYANRTVLATDNSIYQVLPQGIVYPSSEEDIIVLCQLVNEKRFHDIVLSPRGGGTGTNGQSLSDGIIVDLSKHMNNILEINQDEGWVRVQTGVVKDQLNAALKPHGLFFAPELSTSNRATIGGMINTDASGQGSCLYGKTRDHVLSLKTVLLDGSVIASEALGDESRQALCAQQDKAGLIHRVIDNIYQENKARIEEVFPPLNRCLTGYDLAHIRDQDNRFNLNSVLCGSEGTLGFICEAKLNVLPIPKATGLIIVKYADFNASLRDATGLMEAAPTSIETIDSTVLNLAMKDFSWHQVEEFFSDATPEPVQGINLVEYTASSEEQLQEKINNFIKHIQTGLDDSDSNTGRIGYATAWGRESVNKIWAMRKRAVGLLGNADGEARPIPFVEDTAVPPEHLADFILEFREVLDAYQLDYGMFGHVDAGVLHVRPAIDMKDPKQEKMAWEISDRVADLTQQYHGLLWGEHGKGVRSEYAPKFFGDLYPQLQRIKALFDPYNQLNPGKIATPCADIHLLKIDEVPTRGQSDREIPVKIWQDYKEAVYCNGNGACFNWNADDSMCPSWKVTRERTQSPKGRASLIREWLRLISAEENAEKLMGASATNYLPEKIKSWWGKRQGEYDFSHEVYDSMAGCLACKSCAGQCPVKVNVPEFRSQFLAQYHSRYFRPLKDYLVASLEYLLPYCAIVPKLYNVIMQLPPIRWFLEKVVGFVDGPSLTGQSLAQYPIAKAATIEALTAEEKAKTVVIVQDAFTSYFETQVVLDTSALLKTLGFNPLIAPFKPNGKPLHVHGFLKLFARAATKNAAMLNAISEAGLPLIGVDPSMTLTYQSEYKRYVPENNAPNVLLMQDWLADNIERADIPATTAKHFRLMPHCTERTNATNALKHWQHVFKAFGHSMEVLDLGCCGMSGTYGHEARNQANSKKLYTMSWQPKVEQHHDDDSLVATGYSCRSQVKREDNKMLAHPVQALIASFATEATEATEANNALNARLKRLLKRLRRIC